MDNRLQKLISERKKAGEVATFNSPFKPKAKIADQIDTRLDELIGKKHGIVLNERQLQAIEYTRLKKDFCLIGAAGTGKTTTVREMGNTLVKENLLLKMPYATKNLTTNLYRIAFVSFTNRAVLNIRKALPKEFEGNCLTIHKFLEFEPVKITIVDPKTEEVSESMRFLPQRHADNTIPVQVVVIDESSMVSLELHKNLKDACPNATFIYLGDLNQLPPVYGDGILGYKLSEIPVVELDHVYRQALDSPIIRLAYKILAGQGLKNKEVEELSDPKLTFHPWKMQLDADAAAVAAGQFVYNLVKEGKFNSDTDIILCPFNKQLGTIYLNSKMAQAFTDLSGNPVHEIRAGRELLYYSIGDRILFNKREAIITEIVRNGRYVGKPVRDASPNLDRFGNMNLVYGSQSQENIHLDEDSILGSVHSPIFLDDVEEKVNLASHIVKIRYVDNGWQNELTSAGDLNSTSFAYCLSIHKSQGSEWERVYLILHSSHNVMINRELLYTAVTRARDSLYIIYQPETKIGMKNGTFQKGITRQKIKGLTYKDKIKYFVKKKEEGKVNSNLFKHKNDEFELEIDY